MSTDVLINFVDEEAKKGVREAIDLLLPQRKSAQASGYDLVAANRKTVILRPRTRELIPTGIAIALPQGFEAQIRPRSGLALKYGITCLNSPGTIDSDYRGEIKVLLINHSCDEFEITRGMRIAQMVITKTFQVNLVSSQELPETARAQGGFGSTGLSF